MSPTQYTEPESLKRWLAELPFSEPVTVGNSLLQALAYLGRAQVSSRTKIALLEISSARGEDYARAIASGLNTTNFPLSLPRQAIVVLASKVLKELAIQYSSFARKAADSWFSTLGAGHFHLALVRAMELWTVRIALAYRVYASGSKASWSELHQLYQLAMQTDSANKEIHVLGVSPRDVYVRALLLAFSEPAKLRPREIEQCEHYLLRFSRLTHLSRAEEADHQQGLFLIQPSTEYPGRSMKKWASAKVAQGDLLLDTSALVSKIKEQIQALNEGQHADRIGLPVGHDWSDLLTHLLRYWQETPARRSRRMLFHPRMELLTGVEAIAQYLHNLSHVGAIARQAQWSEWQIRNESPNGFAFRYVDGPTNGVAVGEIIAYRPRQTKQVAIGVIRRLHAKGTQAFEIGVEELAPRALPVALQQAGNHVLQGLYLAKIPRWHGAPGLIVPTNGSGLMNLPAIMSLQHQQGRFAARTSLVERTRAIALMRVLPLLAAPKQAGLTARKAY